MHGETLSCFPSPTFFSVRGAVTVCVENARYYSDESGVKTIGKNRTSPFAKISSCKNVETGLVCGYVI